MARRRTCYAVLCVLVSSVIGRAGSARADEPAADAGQLEGPMHPDAQRLYDRGLALFQTHAYASAIADFEAGWALDPRREFLFAEGQAKRLSGDCKGAVALYQRFLVTNPPAVQVNATHIALGRCAQQMAEHPDVVVVAPPPARPPPAPPPPRWWRDPLGLAAAGAGVVGVGIGVGFLVASSIAENDANAAPDLSGYNSRWSTAQTRRSVALIALGAGVTLGAAGAARFVQVRRQGARRDSVVVVSIGPGMLALGGSF